VQIGLILVDGQAVGTIDLSLDDETPPDLGGVEHAGRDWWSDLQMGGRKSESPKIDPQHTPHEPVHRDHGHAAHVSDRAQHHTSRGTPARGDDGVGEGLTGSSYLAARRERFATELRNDPALREQVAGMLVTEGARDPVPVAESLMNRMDFTGGNLQHGLRSGFYGPINRGELPAAISELHRNPELRARMDHAIDTALSGSNLIRGATDQGLPTDPNGQWQGGRVERGGNVFNDWGGSPGGHAGSAAYREGLMRHIEQEHATAAAAPFDPETMAP
jgi:hypothetical protein